MLRTAIAITAFSAHLWTAAIVNVFATVMPGRGGTVLTAGAVMTGVIATVLWKAVADTRQRAGLGLLVRTIADVTRPDAAGGRLRLVREAGAETRPEGSARLPR